jgi:hypothetical protein
MLFIASIQKMEVSKPSCCKANIHYRAFFKESSSSCLLRELVKLLDIAVLEGLLQNNVGSTTNIGRVKPSRLHAPPRQLIPT